MVFRKHPFHFVPKTSKSKM